MHYPIQIGGISVTFLQSRHETGGAFDLFELIVPPTFYLSVPHLHRDYDETILGLNGIATWTINGEEIQVKPGQLLTIPRGAVHSHTNLHNDTARMVCLLTPGLLGPEYFRELAATLNADGPPDIAGIGNIMVRYGVIPIASREVPPFGNPDG
jgi:mannose-6-phosphate isomerase-like protein (cupin superfamily)